MEHDPNTIESRVMGDITNGRVKLRSRYLFLAEHAALGSAVLLTALLAALILSIVFFYLRETETLHYFVFGSDGIYAFLESFPFGLLIVFVLFAFSACMLLRFSEVSYKKPFVVAIAAMLLFITGTGYAVAKTRALDVLETASHEENFAGRALRPLFNHHERARKHGVAGRVIEVKNGMVKIETPAGVRVLNLEKIHAGGRGELAPGSFVMGVGDDAANGEFKMKRMRAVPDAEAPLMKRQIRRKFGPSSMRFFKHEIKVDAGL